MLRARHRGVAAFLLVCLLACMSAPAVAVTLIRDAEIERSLRELAKPLMGAAGVNPNRVDIWVVQDSSLNAFVANPQTMVIHSGLLLELDTPEQVQAVLAHEIAHIANGHLSRRMGNLKASNRLAQLGLILGLAAGAASGEAGAAVGLSLGAADAARRAFFAHTRAEEAAADRSSARYLAASGISPTAMLEVLDKFRGQEALSISRQDPYLRTHPLTRDRIRAAQGYAAAANVRDLPQNSDAYWYARLQGKLSAFLRNPNWTLRRVPNRDKSEVATMRRAIAYHLKPDPARARQEVAALVALRPQDPYYQELQGQIAFESRRFAEAVRYYERALSLAPNEALIEANLGRALLALDTPDANKKALFVLRRAYGKDAENPTLLRSLALAYARAGQTGMASVTTAERYSLQGRLRDAAVHAQRAADQLPTGSPGHARATDILRTAKQIANSR